MNCKVVISPTSNNRELTMPNNLTPLQDPSATVSIHPDRDGADHSSLKQSPAGNSTRTKSVTPRSLRRESSERIQSLLRLQAIYNFKVSYSKNTQNLIVVHRNTSVALDQLAADRRRYLEILVGFKAEKLSALSKFRPTSCESVDKMAAQTVGESISALVRNRAEMRMWGGPTHLAQWLELPRADGSAMYV